MYGSTLVDSDLHSPWVSFIREKGLVIAIRMAMYVMHTKDLADSDYNSCGQAL